MFACAIPAGETNVVSRPVRVARYKRAETVKGERCRKAQLGNKLGNDYTREGGGKGDRASPVDREV